MPTRSGTIFSTTTTSSNEAQHPVSQVFEIHPFLLEEMNVYDLKHFINHLAVQELYDFSLLLEDQPTKK
jgi:hypothetical protein